MNTEYTLSDEVQALLSYSKGKAFAKLRDRAAYMFITGCFPTHLHTETNQLLRLILEFAPTASSLDGRSGGLRIIEGVAVRLDLENHPMVTKVRQFLANGYRVTVSRTGKSRRPYGRVFLSSCRDLEESHISVKCDGSVLDHW